MLVYIRGESRRGGLVVLRCARDELNFSASLEIPEWMFDSGHCSGMKPETLSIVSVSALRAVQELVAPEADHIETSVVQAQHLSRDSGGADAENIQGPTGRAVPSATTATEAFAGCLSADASLVGADDERTFQEGSSSSRTTRGER